MAQMRSLLHWGVCERLSWNAAKPSNPQREHGVPQPQHVVLQASVLLLAIPIPLHMHRDRHCDIVFQG